MRQAERINGILQTSSHIITTGRRRVQEAYHLNLAPKLALTAVAMADLGSTYAGLNNPSLQLHEGNGFATFFLTHFGFAGIVAFKALLTASAIGLADKFHHTIERRVSQTKGPEKGAKVARRLVSRGLWIADVAVAGAVALNTWQQQ